MKNLIKIGFFLGCLVILTIPNLTKAFGSGAYIYATVTPNIADQSVTITVNGDWSSSEAYCLLPDQGGQPPYVTGWDPAPNTVTINSGPLVGKTISVTPKDGAYGVCEGSTYAPGSPATFSGSATFDTSNIPNGSYNTTLRITDGTVSASTTVVINIQHPVQQIYVVSNLATSWFLNGPNGTNQGSLGAPGTYTYPSMPTGVYSISPFSVSCYSVSVNQTPQTLNSGSSITFYLTYASDNTCNVPPPPPPPPSPSPQPPPPPAPGPSPVICSPASSSVNPGQSVTFSAVNGSGSGYTWSAPGANPASGSGSVFTASFPTTNNYTVTVTNGTSAQCKVTVVQTGPPVIPPPPPAPTISFAITYQTTPGTINVNSNVPTHWIASNGTNSYEGVYPSTTGVYTAAPGNYTLTADTLTGYTGPQIMPSSTGTLASNGTLNFNIYYLAIPANLSANPSGCNQVTLSWTGAGPSVSYFQVFRSTSSDPATMQLLSGNLPGNTTTSYTDNTVSANTTYYYMVKSFLTSPSMSASSSVVSAFAQACTPNLANSAKNIYQVQYDGKTWTAYDPTRVIPDAVAIRFKITISNSGSATGTITKIDDTLTPNVINPRNARFDKATGCSSPDPNICPSLSISNSNPPIPTSPYMITITGPGGTNIGDIPVKTNWQVTFDATTNVGTTGTKGLIQNTATIRCVSSGVSCDVTRIVSYVYSAATVKHPQFREVAP